MELKLKELKYLQELSKNDNDTDKNILTAVKKRNLLTKIENEIYLRTHSIKNREDLLFKIVEDTYGINKQQLLKADRKRDVVDIRRALFVILREQYSLAKSGEIMNRDHATTLYNYKMHHQLYGTDDAYTRVYDAIIQEYDNYEFLFF